MQDGKADAGVLSGRRGGVWASKLQDSTASLKGYEAAPRPPGSAGAEVSLPDAVVSEKRLTRVREHDLPDLEDVPTIGE